jgi:hypothetical protein
MHDIRSRIQKVNFLFPFPLGKGLGVRLSALSQCIAYELERRFDIEDRVVWNSEDPYPDACDRLVARFVVLPLLLMHAAIHLDYQLRNVAIEVSDVPFDHLLSTKVKSIQRVSAKGLPKATLRWSHFAP